MIERKGDVYPHGDLNQHLLNVVRESKPYVTVREFLEELIEFIGNQAFYFTREVYARWKLGPQYPELDSSFLAKIKKSANRFNNNKSNIDF